MALVKCVDCGRMISDLAPACNGCGRPVGLSMEQHSIIHNTSPTEQSTPELRPSPVHETNSKKNEISYLPIVLLIIALVGGYVWQYVSGSSPYIQVAGGRAALFVFARVLGMSLLALVPTVIYYITRTNRSRAWALGLSILQLLITLGAIVGRSKHSSGRESQSSPTVNLSSNPYQSNSTGSSADHNTMEMKHSMAAPPILKTTQSKTPKSIQKPTAAPVKSTSPHTTQVSVAAGSDVSTDKDHKGGAEISLANIMKADQTVGELFERRDSFVGVEVRVRGKVVKYSHQVRGINWLHIQDGTGYGPAGYDLTVMSQDVANVGDTVLVTGEITVNKDFGMGYIYDVVLENGSVRVER